MMLRRRNVLLMNRDGGMNDLGLNGLLVDNRLDYLMHVVMHMFAGDSRGSSR